MYNIIIVIVGQSIENVIIFLNISQVRKAEATWAGKKGADHRLAPYFLIFSTSDESCDIT
jgi:hypothetical protein